MLATPAILISTYSTIITVAVLYIKVHAAYQGCIHFNHPAAFGVERLILALKILLTMDVIENVFSAVRQFRLKPARFMVAWNGVLVLAFEGFPLTITSAKDSLKAKLPMILENPGSTWPKVTLAALSGHRTLAESDLKVLERIFARFGNRLTQLELIIDTVSLVHFNCRSLESINQKHNFALTPPVADDSPTDQQTKLVRDILSELKSADYFSLASRPGRDIGYYREACSEWTLVAFINGAMNDIIALVQEEIEIHHSEFKSTAIVTASATYTVWNNVHSTDD